LDWNHILKQGLLALSHAHLCEKRILTPLSGVLIPGCTQDSQSAVWCIGQRFLKGSLMIKTKIALVCKKEGA
jgi:hypothetical protein